MKIKLNSIENTIPKIYIKKIHENSCTENWRCEDWNSCSKQGIQTRVCIDSNKCEIITDKPSTIQDCTSVEICKENWKCTDWGSCMNGEKVRSCTDLNSCGTTQNKLTEQENCTQRIIDCGNNTFSQKTKNNQPNFDCFISASKECRPAKLLNTATIEIFGMVNTSKTYMELKGIEKGKCIYHQKIKNNSIKFSDKTIQQMLNSGITQDKIDQQEQTANNSAQQTIGSEKTCKFNLNYLTTMLNKWGEGNFSTKDLSLAECK